MCMNEQVEWCRRQKFACISTHDSCIHVAKSQAVSVKLRSLRPAAGAGVATATAAVVCLHGVRQSVERCAFFSLGYV